MTSTHGEANAKQSTKRAQTDVKAKNNENTSFRIALVAKVISEQWSQHLSGIINVRKACSEANHRLSPEELERLLPLLPFKEETFFKYAKARKPLRPPATPAHVKAARREFPKAYAPWTKPEETELLRRYKLGQSVDEIAQALERQPGAIRSRLQKLGVAQEPGIGHDGAIQTKG